MLITQQLLKSEKKHWFGEFLEFENIFDVCLTNFEHCPILLLCTDPIEIFQMKMFHKVNGFGITPSAKQIENIPMELYRDLY